MEKQKGIADMVYAIAKKVPKSLIWVLFALGYGVIYFGPPFLFLNVILGFAMVIIAAVALIIWLEGWQ